MLSEIEITTAFADATDFVRNLKKALPMLCPDCKQKIRDSLFNEKTGEGYEPAHQNQTAITAGANYYERQK
jgi:hypothetical protein